MPLFLDLPSQLSALDKVKVITTRHQHNYFQGWTRQHIEDSNLDAHIKPLEPKRENKSPTNSTGFQ